MTWRKSLRPGRGIMLRGLSTLAFLAMSACAMSNGVPATPARSSEPVVALAQADDLLNSVVPSVDHHTHLMGPAIAAIASGASIAADLDVPADIDSLLRAREAASKDAEALLPLFTRDAVLLGPSRSGWISGSRDVTDMLVKLFGRPYSIKPVHYERSGNAAQLSGYYTRGEGEARQYVGYVHMSLVRSAGRWLIAAEVPRFPLSPAQQVRTAEQLIAEMDEAGIRRSVVLSEAFWADGPQIQVDNPYPVVMAENDWTAQQVSMFPHRLIAFCSFNPVADHALRELERCAANPVFKGLKFSFGMSGVDLKNPAHVDRLKAVFAAANARRLPIVVHTRAGPDYGAEHVGIFLREVLPAAPGIVVQIAHLWGGEGYSAAALQAFADAIAAGQPHTRNLYFDVSEITAGIAGTANRATQQQIAELMRRIGIQRMLFGSDGQNPAQSWRSLVGFIPLRESELRKIGSNVAPYLRD